MKYVILDCCLVSGGLLSCDKIIFSCFEHLFTDEEYIFALQVSADNIMGNA